MKIIRNLFRSLKDTPDSYEDQQSKLVRVTPAEDGVEFLEDLLLPEAIVPDTPVAELYDIASGLPVGTYNYKVQGCLNEEVIASLVAKGIGSIAVTSPRIATTSGNDMYVSTDSSIIKLTSESIVATITTNVNSPTDLVAIDSDNVWVVNSGNNTVGAVKITAIPSSSVAATIVVGTGPGAVCFDGTHVWVANNKTHNVTKINASTNAYVATIVVGSNPSGICFDGTHVWVANYTTDNVTKINATTNAYVATIVVGTGPYAVCFDGTHVWVSNYITNDVTKINASTNAYVATIVVGTNPRGICFDGTHVWVANYGTNNVTKITNVGAVTKSLPVTSTKNIVYDGTYLWTTNSTSNALLKISSTLLDFNYSLLIFNAKIIATVIVGTTPWGVAFDGTHVWVANYDSDNVTKINATTNAIAATVTIGTGPRTVRYSNGNIWILNHTSQTISRINTTTNAVSQTYTIAEDLQDFCVASNFIYFITSTGSFKSIGLTDESISTLDTIAGAYSIITYQGNLLIADNDSNELRKILIVKSLSINPDTGTLLCKTAASEASNSIILESENSIKITVSKIDSPHVKNRLVYGSLPGSSTQYQLVNIIDNNEETAYVYDLGRTFPTGSTYDANIMLNPIDSTKVIIRDDQDYLALTTPSKRIWQY